jgi:hypothetical protein
MFMAAELIVGALVIQSTWRKTILTVTPADMTLQFIAPFTARQRFVFPSEQIAGVVVVDRPPLPGEAVVPELEIRMWSIPPVQLFAGHPRTTLMTIAQEIGHVQPMAPPPLPEADAAGIDAKAHVTTVSALANVRARRGEKSSPESPGARENS